MHEVKEINQTAIVHDWINSNTLDGDQITSVQVDAVLNFKHSSAALHRMTKLGVVKPLYRKGKITVFEVVDRSQEPHRSKRPEVHSRNRLPGYAATRLDLPRQDGERPVSASQPVARIEDSAQLGASLNSIAMGLLDYAVQLERLTPDIRSFSTFELTAELARRKLEGET